MSFMQAHKQQLQRPPSSHSHVPWRPSPPTSCWAGASCTQARS